MRPCKFNERGNLGFLKVNVNQSGVNLSLSASNSGDD